MSHSKNRHERRAQAAFARGKRRGDDGVIDISRDSLPWSVLERDRSCRVCTSSHVPDFWRRLTGGRDK